jgi:cell division protein FtsB
VPRAAKSPSRPTTTARATDLGSAAMESVLDRLLVKRLRPLRAEATAGRKALAAQVDLRVEAESRAAHLEEQNQQLETEAQQLRLRVQTLEQELAAAQQRRTGWFRRRSSSLRPQEA